MWHLHGSLGLALAAPDHDDDDDVDDSNGEDDGGGNTSCLLATSPNSKVKWFWFKWGEKWLCHHF